MNKQQLIERLEELYNTYREEYDKQCEPYWMGAYSAIDIALQEVEGLDEQ